MSARTLSVPVPTVIAQRLTEAAQATRVPLTAQQIAVLAHHMAGAAARDYHAKAARLGYPPRLTETLHGLAAGDGSGDAAASLGIAANTVKMHRKHLYRVLGARSGSHAVAIACCLGLHAPLDVVPARRVSWAGEAS